MNRYGPHRPEDAPAALPNPDRRIADLIPVPPALLRQRERINQLAHEAVADDD